MAKGETLPAKQARFVEEYLKDLNASAAYLRAGYKTANPNVMGPALLAKPRIKDLVRQAMDKRSARTQITADDVLRFWKRRMDFNPKALYREDGSLIPIPDLPDEIAQCLAAVETVVMAGSEETALYLKKVKWADGEAAAANAAKHLGMFTEKVELSGKDGEPIVIHLHAGPRDKA